MGQVATLQSRITFSGDTSGGDVHESQPIDQALDVRNWSAAVVTAHGINVSVTSGDSFALSVGTMPGESNEGVDIVPNGPGEMVADFSGIASGQWKKQLVTTAQSSVSSTTYPLEGLLGWHFDVTKGTTGGAYSVTFEVFVTLKKSA